MGGACAWKRREEYKMCTHMQWTHACFWSDLQMFLCAVVAMMSILVSMGTSSSNYLLMVLSPSTPPLASSTAGTVSHSFRRKHMRRHSARPTDGQTHVHTQLGRNQLTQTNTDGQTWQAAHTLKQDSTNPSRHTQIQKLCTHKHTKAEPYRCFPAWAHG